MQLKPSRIHDMIEMGPWICVGSSLEHCGKMAASSRSDMICVGRLPGGPAPGSSPPPRPPSAMRKRRSTQARRAIRRQAAGVEASAARRNPREAHSSYWS